MWFECKLELIECYDHMPFAVAIVLQQTNTSECKFYKVEMKQMLAQKPLDEKVQVPYL